LSPFHALHLALFTAFHAVYALYLLISGASTWLSPAEAAQEARAMGAAVHDSTPSSEPGRPIKMPKHLALILQTPYTGLPPASELERTSSQADANGGPLAPAEALAAKFLSGEVRKVCTWCEQLGIERLTVMDTGGLLRRTGVLSAEADDASQPLSDKPEPFSSTAVRLQLLVPGEGSRILAQATEQLRSELDHKLHDSSQLLVRKRRGRRRRTMRSASTQTSVGGAAEDEDGWTEVHAREGDDWGELLPRGGDSDDDDDEELDRIRTEAEAWIEEITVARMDAALEKLAYISEPDFLILHGTPKRMVQLHGFPAWAVRLTELFHDPLADPRHPITLATFVRALRYFNRTEHRFGK